jgi:hypothetical protein
MILIILMTVWFAALAALAVRIAIVRRERTGSERTRSEHTGPALWERSPHLLNAGRDSLQPPGNDSLQQAINEAMNATPEVKATPLAVSSSEPAAAEHVRDGAQEDLYVGP